MGQSLFRAWAGWTAFCGELFLAATGHAHADFASDKIGAAAMGAAAMGAAAIGAAANTRRGVLVHGIHDSARSMRWMKRRLEARGWIVWAITLTPSDGSVPFEVMARQLDQFIAGNIPAHEKLDLVGFSMGGLVCRYYVQKLGGWKRVRRFVTISTPNHGTIWAWLSGRAAVRQMRPGSPMLRELNADAARLAPLHYTSIYTPLDLTIIPAVSSRMPAARNLAVWIPLHHFMVMMPGPAEAVERALEAPP